MTADHLVSKPRQEIRGYFPGEIKAKTEEEKEWRRNFQEERRAFEKPLR